MKNTAQNGKDIKATFAWDDTTGSADVTVAVIDYTGIQDYHTDFKMRGTQESRIIEGQYGDYNYYNSHGTAVAGILAATGDDGYGVAGVDWECKVLNEYLPSYTYQELINRINDAVNPPFNAKIISFSGGIQHWNETFSAGGPIRLIDGGPCT